MNTMECMNRTVYPKLRQEPVFIDLNEAVAKVCESAVRFFQWIGQLVTKMFLGFVATKVKPQPLLGVIFFAMIGIHVPLKR